MGVRHGLEVGISYPYAHHRAVLLSLPWRFRTTRVANPTSSYALQWLVVLPLEIISGALAIQYWNSSLNPAIFITIFLFAIIAINMTGIKGYGEAEFVFSIVKVAAIVGFM
jgi:amino acid transporter